MIFDLKRLPILETERLRLEPLTAADAEHLYPIMGDPEVMAYWDVPEVEDPDIVAGRRRRPGRRHGRRLGDLLGHAHPGRPDVRRIVRTLRDRTLDTVAEVGFMVPRDALGPGLSPGGGAPPSIAFAATGGLRKLDRATHRATAAPRRCWRSWASPRKACCAAISSSDGERRDCRPVRASALSHRPLSESHDPSYRHPGLRPHRAWIRDKDRALAFYTDVLVSPSTATGLNWA